MSAADLVPQFISATMVAFSIGLLVGKWLTDIRWSRNAREVWRINFGRKLYKVEDVTPWKNT